MIVIRGLGRDGGKAGAETVVAENPARWTSKYGSVVCAFYEVGTVDGMNEKTQDREILEKELGEPGPDRIWYVGDAFAAGWSLDEVHDITKIDKWFLVQIEEIVKIELELDKIAAAKGEGALASLDAGTLRTLKQKGFSDRRLAKLLKTTDKACDYLPACPEPWKPITIHQLLTHTSGIVNFTSIKEFQRLKFLPSRYEEQYKAVRDLKMDFDPGTNVVDVSVQRLRKKLSNPNPETGPAFPIETIRGVGYRIDPAFVLPT